MINGNNGGDSHYRYDTQRRYIRQKQKKSPVGLMVISSILLISTVVLSFALFKTNKDVPIDEKVVDATPVATPQPTTDNRVPALITLMQQTINQANEGELSSVARTSLEKQGISSESLDVLENIIKQTPEESQYNDGAFIGVADGDRGQIKVEVTISNGKILYVSVVDHNEKITSELIEVFRSITVTILTNQSTSDIDAISGATLISEGFIGAIDDALSKAKK